LLVKPRGFNWNLFEGKIMKYNNNINLIVRADNQLTLAPQEYFALMVTDTKKGDTDKRRFYNEKEGWLGLECTSQPKRVYISKSFRERRNLHRGDTWLVEVKNANLCFVLSD